MAGVYTVTVTNGTGCTATATTTVAVNSCVGIEGTEDDEYIKVYPNPNDGTFNIMLSTSQTNPYSLSIYNTLGHVIYQKNNIPTTELSGYPIDISTIAAGIYTLVVNINNIPHSIKVVKK